MKNKRKPTKMRKLGKPISLEQQYRELAKNFYKPKSNMQGALERFPDDSETPQLWTTVVTYGAFEKPIL